MGIKLLSAAIDAAITDGREYKPYGLVKPRKYAEPLPPILEVTSLLAYSYKAYVNVRCSAEISDDAKQKLLRVAQWMASDSLGLALYGGFGTGKTTLLKAIKNVLRFGSVFRTAYDIFIEYKNIGSIPLEYTNTDVLIIDDVGIEPDKCVWYGETHNPIAELLVRRYEKMKTTIFSTNLDLPDLEKRYGTRVYDRLLEMFEFIVFEGISYRRSQY